MENETSNVIDAMASIKNFYIPTNGFYASLMIPSKELYPGKVMIILGGGGVPYQLTVDEAYAFVEMGIAALSLGYFDVPNAPETITKVPIEFVEKAVECLKTEGFDKIAVAGISKGAELALLSASLLPHINGVIAVSPPSKVYMGLGKKISWVKESSWTYQGKEIPYAYTRVNRWKVYLKSMIKREPTFIDIYRKADETADDSMTIKCENIKGPIMLVSAEYDSMWPSKQACEEMKERLAKKAFPYAVTHLNYQYASHMILPFKASTHKLFREERRHPKECSQTIETFKSEILNWMEQL